MTNTTDLFVLQATLGTVTVPSYYNEERCFAALRAMWDYLQGSYDPGNYDDTCPSATRVMKPGERFLVTAHVESRPGTTTEADRLAFLESDGGVRLGARGAILVLQQLRRQLVKGQWHWFLDAPAHLVPSRGRGSYPTFITLRSDGDSENVDFGWFPLGELNQGAAMSNDVLIRFDLVAPAT